MPRRPRLDRVLRTVATLQPGATAGCDIETFGSPHRGSPGPAGGAALPALQRAVTAYGGDFLAGMAAGEWAQARRDELAAPSSRRCSRWPAACGCGPLPGGRGGVPPGIGHEPLNETAHRELMSCWERLGETARAIRHYEELAETLQDQLGVPPSAETTALYGRLRAR